MEEKINEIIAEHNEAIQARQKLNATIADTTHAMTRFAVEHNMDEVLTLNVRKFERLLRLNGIK